MNRSKLVVEGQTDTLFFEALVQKENLAIEVEPRHSITKIPDLLEALFDDLRDGVLEHLGIVADADYTTPKSIGGFNNRWQQLTQPLKKMGYEIAAPPSQNYVGSIFTHDNGLPPVGLWLMPDHQNDGMLEDLIKQTVCEGQQLTLFQTATLCLNQLPARLFKPHHHTKATVYTWLAWQKRPGQAFFGVQGCLALFFLSTIKIHQKKEKENIMNELARARQPCTPVINPFLNAISVVINPFL